ncbi:LytR/AlgR family response regulator transcription factor [Longitalea luteola]|uniref:LytR/AlgR family response regulator transcription factor n=1 Tax=Longitalea luteola TaxID=2812563 RepID=UPI001A96E3F3|nr:LytTR family DNA-binding domain-containing protein [Longitalea luteola]
MINALIVDDEPKNLRILQGLLGESCPDVRVVGEAVSAETAIPLIASLKPDLVFLDIEMPHGNAFDLLDRIMPVNFEIIFITAFDSYTLKAFKYSALDYLLKPVSMDELRTAVLKARERIRFKNINEQLQTLLFNINKPNSALQKIALPNNEGLVFVQMADIIRFEAKGGYTYVHTTGNQKYVSSRMVKEYEEILPSDLFFRIHNSHIINLNFVVKYHKGRGGVIEMSDNAIIEVATRRKEEFLNRFGIR